MSPTARDRTIVLIIVPVLAIIGYWFLLLGPKRDEASKLGSELSKQEKKADEANAAADRLKAAAKNFHGEYTSLVRLGKAVPSSVDMPSLLVQLNRAAAGTHIRFGSISVGDRAGGGAAPAASGGSGGSGGQSGQGTPPVAAGGQQAQSAPGKPVEKANNAAAGADQSNAARQQDPTNTQTSTTAKPGSVPVGGGTPTQTAQGAAAAGSGVPGLDSVPLTMSFRGSYFDLASFFHRLKRFVRVANEKIRVQGRLLTIDGLSFTGGGNLTAVLKATVYLVPKRQGVGAGATPAGPQATPTTAQGAKSTPPSSTTAPTATVSPR